MPVLLDSSIYISAVRMDGGDDILLHRHIYGSPLWLSSVVLEELYAGADPASCRVLEKMQRDFERIGRILTPNLSDWVQTGKILSRLAQKYRYEDIGRTRLTNEALIATSAARAGIMVVTANKRDFARLAEFCPLQWQMDSLQN
jgi:predicted nucleic acid-binding protein